MKGYFLIWEVCYFSQCIGFASAAGQVVVESVERVPSQERPALWLTGSSAHLAEAGVVSWLGRGDRRIDRSDYPAGFSIQHILRSPRQLYARCRSHPDPICHAPLVGRATAIIDPLRCQKTLT